jgi:hypothetical protein
MGYITFDNNNITYNGIYVKLYCVKFFFFFFQKPKTGEVQLFLVHYLFLLLHMAQAHAILFGNFKVLV